MSLRAPRKRRDRNRDRGNRRCVLELSLPCFVIESDHELRVVDRDALRHALRRWRDDMGAVAEDPDYVPSRRCASMACSA
jgi:hypothetical protein